MIANKNSIAVAVDCVASCELACWLGADQVLCDGIVLNMVLWQFDGNWGHYLTNVVFSETSLHSADWIHTILRLLFPHFDESARKSTCLTGD